MELQMTTPALLFSTISLLLLAFTNRFLATAQVIRSLYDRYQKDHDNVLLGQITNLQRRLRLTRNMQFFLVMSLLFSVLCMFLLFAGENAIATWVFGISMILLVIALLISSHEIYISTQALELQIKDILDQEDRKGFFHK